MIRAALAVALAAALVGASLPAVDDARRDRTAARLERAADRIAEAAAGLRRDDPGIAAGLAPRRVVRVHLPARSWTAGGVERFRVAGGGPDAPASVTYDLAGRSATTRRLDAPVRTPAGPVRLREAGTHHLRLALLRRRGQVVVAVRRVRL